MRPWTIYHLSYINFNKYPLKNKMMNRSKCREPSFYLRKAALEFKDIDRKTIGEEARGKGP